MKIKTIITTMIAATLLMGCGNSTKTEETQSATVEVVNDTIVLPTPQMDLNLYFHEDSTSVVEKVKAAFELKEGLVAQQNDVKATYHIICNEKQWLSYFTISYSSNKFETLEALIDSLNTSFAESDIYKWDEERKQYTNGKQYVYLQQVKRDEDDGEIYAVCCIMPTERK